MKQDISQTEHHIYLCHAAKCNLRKAVDKEEKRIPQISRNFKCNSTERVIVSHIFFFKFHAELSS